MQAVAAASPKLSPMVKQTEGRIWYRVEGVEALNVLTDIGLSVRLRVSVLAQFIFLSI